MSGKKSVQATIASTASQSNDTGRKRWVKLTPRDHVIKQIEAQETLVDELRRQLAKEEQTLAGMQKAKEFFPA